MSIDKHSASHSYIQSAWRWIMRPGPRRRTLRIPFSRGWLWLLLSGAAVLLSGCADKDQSFLTPSGPVSALEYHHLLLVTLVTLIVVAPVIVGVPLLSWRYRYGNSAP